MRSCVRRARSSAFSQSYPTNCAGSTSLRGLSTLPNDANSTHVPEVAGAPIPSQLVESVPVEKIARPVAEIAPISIPASPAPSGESDRTAPIAADPTPAASSEPLIPIADASTAVSGASSSANAADAAAAAANAADPAVAAQAAETVATAGLSFSDTLLQPAMFLLNTVHDVSGMPWWMAIGVATVLVRTAILPLSISTMRNSARMGALQGEIGDRREEVMAAMRTGDQSKAMKKQEEMKTFMTDAGVSPGKLLMGPLVQFPIFISFFVAVRRLALNDPTMTTGGAFWFTDLSVADPMYILPVVSGLSLAAMTELGGDTGTKVTPVMKRGLRAMAVLSVPFTYWFPVGVFCYWLPNNVYSVAFSLAMRSKTLKNVLGMHVDLATIPGTKANLRANRENALNPPVSAERLTAAAAAASYIRKVDALSADDVTSASTPSVSGKKVQPVLFKQRPKKRRAKNRA